MACNRPTFSVRSSRRLFAPVPWVWTVHQAAGIALLLAVGAACSGDSAPPTEPPPAPVDALRGIIVAPPSGSIRVGQTLALTPTPDRAGGSVTVTYAWTSSAPAVATVTDGTVAAVAPGSATITVTGTGSASGFTTNSRSTTATVTVLPLDPAITGLTVTPTDTASIAPGGTVTITANATAATGAAVTYTYESATPAVATVNASGVVTGVTGGTATITVTAIGTGAGLAPATREATVVVRVVPPPAIRDLTVTPDSTDVFTGRQTTLAVAADQPNGAPAWTTTASSSATAVATVTVASSGSVTVTGVAPGSATITVTASAPATSTFAAATVERPVTVRVVQAPNALTGLTVSPDTGTVAAGADLTLVPAAQTGDPAVTVSYAWVSSSPAVASVSDAGVVTGVAVGSATITVTATGSAPGFTTSTREVTVPVTITAPAPVLGIGFGEEQFAVIPGGTFVMGTPSGGDADERPLRTVELFVYGMQKTEVTQAQWRQVMAGTGFENPSFHTACGDTCPVEQVSWDDIQLFLTRLNAVATGSFYRLPTEAEWEYAARAGTTGDYGGTGVLNEMAWWEGNSGGRAHPVATKLPNAWGIHDMHGNVWEWVRDWYGPYPAVNEMSPQGPLTGSARVRRGGSWDDDPDSMRSGNRGSGTPSTRRHDRGFRLVRVMIM